MKEESKLIELFKKYPGIAARIRRSFAYHYDQIQREIKSEVATINKDDAATIIDYTTEYMEESMGWPDADDQTTLTNKTYNIMTTLNSTSVLASIIAQNPYHIISIQGQMPMSHAQNTYDFEIAEDDPHYEEILDYSLEMLWVYTYADKESLELDLMEILNQMDLLRGCDDQYFDYNVDEVDMVLYGATIIQEQEKYKPLIMQKFQYYKDNFNEEEHAEEIEYYLNFLEKPETLYTFTENTINFFKSLIK
jgi:hypothetical protein